MFFLSDAIANLRFAYPKPSCAKTSRKNRSVALGSLGPSSPSAAHRVRFPDVFTRHSERASNMRFLITLYKASPDGGYPRIAISPALFLAAPSFGLGEQAVVVVHFPLYLPTVYGGLPRACASISRIGMFMFSRIQSSFRRIALPPLHSTSRPIRLVFDTICTRVAFH